MSVQHWQWHTFQTVNPIHFLHSSAFCIEILHLQYITLMLSKGKLNKIYIFIKNILFYSQNTELQLN